MELYYKDLISEEETLDKLVDDLMLVVQGVDELAKAAGVNLPRKPREELASRLERLKASCQRLKDRAYASARATDKLVRRYPYATLGVALAAGLLAGSLFARRR
jgi:ElaB/YqjD/DUF883 family membrane-anchored ribosome-binding protein